MATLSPQAAASWRIDTPAEPRRLISAEGGVEDARPRVGRRGGGGRVHQRAGSGVNTAGRCSSDSTSDELPRCGDRALGDLDVAEAPEQLLEHDPHLGPGQVGAQAVVRADAERDVGVRAAVDEHLVGAVEHRLVPVGRLVEQEDLVARLQRLAVQLVVLGDRAGERHHR